MFSTKTQSLDQKRDAIMLDTKAFYSIFKSVLMQKAKEQHKPTLSNLESMKAYQQATGSTQRASFKVGNDYQACGAIDYV